MKLKIDAREHALIACCQDIQFESCNLNIGDIQICNDNDDILLIFERKTIADLNSSIKDGRYHEQKSRLVSNVEISRICYIIEGNITSSKFIDSNVIFGAILNTMYRDNIRVYRSRDITDTYNFIFALFTRINKEPEKWKMYFESKSENVENCDVDPKVYKLSAVKSKNITKEIVFINSLNNINGCSSKIAKAIYDQYQSLKGLLDAFEDSDNPEELLKDIKVGSKKIGPTLSKRIYDFLY